MAPDDTSMPVCASFWRANVPLPAIPAPQNIPPPMMNSPLALTSPAFTFIPPCSILKPPMPVVPVIWLQVSPAAVSSASYIMCFPSPDPTRMVPEAVKLVTPERSPAVAVITPSVSEPPVTEPDATKSFTPVSVSVTFTNCEPSAGDNALKLMVLGISTVLVESVSPIRTLVNLAPPVTFKAMSGSSDTQL